jgi:DNA-binding CsgD family transcriptional regulator
MLDAQRGLALRHGRVRLDRVRSQAALERGARKLAISQEDTERVVVDVHDARGIQTYELSLAPAIGDGKHDIAPAANVILFITEIPTEPAPGQVEGLMRRFDLTPAEARVAALIAWSRSRAAVAEQLGISENTVKSHLKVIHDKLGIRTRAELVRHVLGRF